MYNLDEDGYTLLELLISLALSAVLTLVVANFFITEHVIYENQEADSEMNQTLRSALVMFTSELLLAGYGLPSDREIITGYSSEEIYFRSNLRNRFTHLTSAASAGENILNVSTGTGTYFEKGDEIIICSDRLSDQCEEHTLLKDGTSSSIILTSPLMTAFDARSRIDLINRISYRYNRSKKQLQRKIDRGVWEPVAENLAEDGLEISYFDRDNHTPGDSSQIHHVDIVLTLETYRKANAKSTVMLRNII